MFKHLLPFKHILPALLLLIVFTVLTGLIYPLFITGIAQVAFRGAANGSLIVRDGKVLGSRLIGQAFTAPKYFWSRPSATGPGPYNAASSSGSNLGPTNPDLEKAVKERIAKLRESDPANPAPIPVDLVTASASGLDPHISMAAANWQVARVAKVRGLAADQVRKLVDQFTARRQFGILGEPGVNVLQLNLALDTLR
jgi:K+-transporting ATPase ATPase C chain